MTSATPAPLDPYEALRLTEQIRVALDRVATSWADLADRVAEAYERRADLALGYSSWAEYAAAELRPSEGIAADVRRELVGLLSAKGMSTRAIAPAVGVSNKTISIDRQSLASGQVLPEVTPAAPAVGVTQRQVSTDVRSNFSPADDRAAQDGLDAVNDTLAEARLTGLDGKSYPRTAARPERRRPWPEAAADAAYRLSKLTTTIVNLSRDDRFDAHKNKNEASRLRKDLALAIDALQRVHDQLTTH